jgi:hypothetical protein
VIFNSKIADERALARAAVRRCLVAAMSRAVARSLKPLSGQHAARPDSPPRARPPDSARPLASPLTPPSRPPRSEATSPGPPPRPPHRSPAAVVPRRAAVPAPVSRPFLAVYCAPAPCRRRFTEQRRRQAAPPRAHTVRRAVRGPAELGSTSARTMHLGLSVVSAQRHSN